MDIESRLNRTYKRFLSDIANDNIAIEDDIAMYGNRYRRILENLLKFMCLAKRIMFKNSYEKDMLGELITRLRTQDPINSFERVLPDSLCESIIQMQERLNFLSHENVSKMDINKETIEQLNADMLAITRGSLAFLLQSSLIIE